MPSEITLVPDDSSVPPIVLSEGTGTGIWLDQGQDTLFPVPLLNEKWTEGDVGEGSQRISYRPENPVATGKVYIAGETTSGFRNYIHQWQSTVYSVNAFGGRLVYVPEGGEAITYVIRSMAITSLPQDGVWIKNKLGQSEFTITYSPYGLLEPVEVFSDLESTQPVTGFDIGDRPYSTGVLGDEPALYWRLGSGGATDLSGNGRNGTGSGEINIGASLGALANDPDGSTTFDGINDRIVSTYKPFSAGSVRTFEGWAYRANTSAQHTIWGGSGASTPPRLTLLSGNQTVFFTAGGAGSTTWTAAWPGVNQWVHWALIFDDPGNMVELFINGVSIGVKEVTETYASPGNFEVGSQAGGSGIWNGKQDEVAIYEGRLSPERVFAHYLAGKYRVAVPGSAPALVDLTITETQGLTRDHFEYGLDSNYDPAHPTPLLIDAPAEVTTSEFAGVAATRAGAHSLTGSDTNVCRATLYSEPIALCSIITAAVGKTRVKARMYTDATSSTYVRMAWRRSEGAFTYNEWQSVGNPAGFYELDLGVINSPKVQVGTQSVEIWLEAYATQNGQTVDLDYLILVPLAAYGKATVEPNTETSASPVMQEDASNHSAGNLSGKSAPIGGEWKTVTLKTGEPNFQVDSAHQIYYSATQAEGGWKEAIAYTSSPSALGPTVLAWDGLYYTTASEFFAAVGGVVRYIDQWNWVAAVLKHQVVLGSGQPRLEIIKSKNGTTSVIGNTWESAGFARNLEWWRYRVAVDAAGVWTFQAGPRNNSLTTYLGGQDADLAETGKLGKGRVGLFGYPWATTSGTSTAVYWDNIVAFTQAPSTHVVNANKQIELTSGALRKEPVSGSTWTDEVLEGGYPKVEPNRTSRIVVKSRANNVDSHTDSATWNGPIRPKEGTTKNAVNSGAGTVIAETSLVKPAAATAGALMLASMAYVNGATPKGVAVMGYNTEALWTKPQASYGLYAFYTIATEADPTIAAVATGTTSVMFSALIVPYLGVDATAPINVSATNSGTGTAVTAPSVTTTLPNCLIVVAIGVPNTASVLPTITKPSTMTLGGEGLGSSGTLRTKVAQYYDQTQQKEAGASGTRAFTLSASSEWVAHTFALAPAKSLDSFKASLTITPRVQLVAN